MKDLTSIMAEHNIEMYGICNYADVYSDIPCRGKANIPEKAKRVITCLFPYYSSDFPNRNVSRYAVCDDYHIIVGDILSDICTALHEHYDGNFVSFADISPLDEKQCAILCGLGFMGKNGLVINEKYGTYFFIGEIVTDIEFAIDNNNTVIKSCIDCNECEKNCPGKAISSDGINYDLCVSKLTQLKRELSENEIESIKKVGYVWGCDICQDSCIYNKAAVKSTHKRFSENTSDIISHENLDVLLKTKAYGYKGKKLLLRNLAYINEKKGIK